MPLIDLNEDEMHVVLECLRASVRGPFFPIWEFSLLFGLGHAHVSDIAFGPWPPDDSNHDVSVAINNAMNNLTGYPHRQSPEVWRQYISASPEEVLRIYYKWRGKKAEKPSAKSVLDETM